MADTVNMVTLTINGRETTVPKGTTVLEAAKMMGIEIPTFCWHPKLKPVGACRICYVEIEKMPKLQVSCATEVMPGMVVNTESEKVKQGRKAVLEFLLINHPLDCPTCDKGGECDLQDNTFNHGIDDSRFDFRKYRFIRDRKSTFDDYRIGPEIIRNQNRCIRCFKCVRANKEAFGEYDLGAFQRGDITEIDAAPGEMVDSIYSGNLVEICPVGALTNTDWRYKIRVWKTQKIDSICSYCADGCNLTLWKDRNRIYRVTSRRNDAIDEGWICDIGRYGYQITNSDSRLTTPLIKKGDKQVASSWEEAIELIARKFKEIKEKKGGVCIGGLITSSIDSNSLYAFSKFFRTVIHSNNVDFRTEYKMLPEKHGDLYTRLTEQKFSIADIEKSDLILVVGSNLIKEHPIINLRVHKTVTRKAASLYTINPIATKSGEISQDEMVNAPGTMEALLNGVVMALTEKTGGADKFRSLLEPNSVGQAAEISGISEERIRALAEAMVKATNITLIAGEFISTSSSREVLASAINNLAIAAGIYEKGQVGILSKYANSKGAERLGVMPHLSDSMISDFKKIWGYYPENPGLASDRMILGAKKEEIDSLLIIGANPIGNYPDGEFVREGIEKLDFLAVADMCESETSEMADVVLPLAGWAEYDGSFVNVEGREQSFRAAIKPVGNSLPGYEIVRLIAEAMKEPIYEDFRTLAEEANGLLQRTPATAAPEITEVKYIKESAPSEFPFPLFVVDDMHHMGHRTEKSKSLAAFCGEPYLEISPSVADKLGIADGDMVKVESETGKVILGARISEHLDNNVALVSRTFAAPPVNILQMRKRRIDWVRLTRMEEA
ncbi:putative NADH-quinone oxidoreductase subunit G 2 [Candidatus Zixiibacteriota bacterium]|nr:putative NADH-quinone oxidoreductase subunit G 2 [candidate division Zixibacteria bacterium]